MFGICGSGKSSILHAINLEQKPTDTKCGASPESVVVEVDGKKPNFSDTVLYCSKTQTALFEQKANEKTYRILVGNESTLEEKETDFLSAIKDLRNHLDEFHQFRSRVDELEKQIGKAKNGNKEFAGTARIIKFEKAVKSSSASVKEIAKTQGIEYMQWKADGAAISSDFQNGFCPFCGKKLDDETKLIVNEVANLKLSDLKIIASSTTALDELGLPKISDISDEAQLDSFKEKILSLYRIREDISELITFCMTPEIALRDHTSIEPLEISSETIRIFPELTSLVRDINDKLATLKNLIGEMRKAFNSLVKKNLLELNNALLTFGIPYSFSEDSTDRRSKTASFALSHIDGSKADDMRESLSTGERNIVALLLFLHDDSREVLLIDDPASSFDDYRRGQIYSQICQVRDRTVIVVSHDQAFIRRAVNDRRNSNLGKVEMITTTDFTSIQGISKSDFCNLSDEILKRINSSVSYEQRIINIRLYLDLHREKFKIAWRYCSAILHGKDKQEIVRSLSDSNLNEDDALEELRNAGIVLDSMPDQMSFDTVQDLCEFEELILLREKLISIKKSGTHLSSCQQSQLNMLNDVVHMNDSNLFCLNPYSHLLWPPVLIKGISQND